MTPPTTRFRHKSPHKLQLQHNCVTTPSPEHCTSPMILTLNPVSACLLDATFWKLSDDTT